MSKRGWIVVVVLYVAMAAAVMFGLRYTRDEIAPALATAQGQADWQAWREETAKQAHGKGPVARREQTTAEPPLVILMRDHYATCVVGALVFTTVLFGVMAILIRGAVLAERKVSKTTGQKTRLSYGDARALMSVHAEPPVAAVASKPLANEFSYARWSLRDEPRIALGAIAPVALLGTATALTTGSTFATTLVVLAMIAANWSVFLPIRYTLDAFGIERRCGPWRRRIPWSMVGHCDFQPTGVRLFRNSHPAPLDLLGCVFIPWGLHREVVIAHLRRRLAVTTPAKPSSDNAATGNDETATAIDGLGRPGA